MLIQQRINASNVFNRSWAEFKVGFNDSRGNYWLGNELLSQLTVNHRYKLKFDLQARSNSNWYHAEYSTFRVHSEADNYRLQVSGYSRNADDAFGSYNGSMFTTFDRDNDERASGNWAASHGGGFWYGNLNCGVNTAIPHFIWVMLPHGDPYLQFTRMWLQCE